ncbi:NAD(P)H-dependent flavin oxidoreductase [Sphingosinithalassobacter portus]|uniref:NAD(P)H-dependent flavin oxidoreductase n=1 Tax=Stakelama portus TaxID=2676234 RepID=UPI000D6E1ED3|nr:nitronate monooxygenase [Sphingosinithalassobacter portus]
MDFLDRFGLTVPLVQAPMAGVSTPELASQVSEAGALGSIGVGATDADGAAAMIAAVRARTGGSFNVNFFVHATPRTDAQRETAWLAALAPVFAEFGAEPPAQLRTIYNSFADDPAMVRMLLALRPPIVSFHFGLPDAAVIAALRQAGMFLLATVTSLAEAKRARDCGIDALVAQGIEAGGHRGIFDPDSRDDALGTMALTRLLVRDFELPIIAAGGIMDGAGIAAARALGAVAAQLGTAFIACPESAADDAYRAALISSAAHHSRMTRLISGRPARALANRFTALETQLSGVTPPDYPRAYDAGKALNAAAKASGEAGFGVQWAGQGAPLSRAMPAAKLVAQLRDEFMAAINR